MPHFVIDHQDRTVEYTCLKPRSSNFFLYELRISREFNMQIIYKIEYCTSGFSTGSRNSNANFFLQREECSTHCNIDIIHYFKLLVSMIQTKVKIMAPPSKAIQNRIKREKKKRLKLTGEIFTAVLPNKIET